MVICHLYTLHSVHCDQGSQHLSPYHYYSATDHTPYVVLFITVTYYLSTWTFVPLYSLQLFCPSPLRHPPTLPLATTNFFLCIYKSDILTF